MRKTVLSAAFALLGMLAIPGMASAGLVVCPDSVGGGDSARQYGVRLPDPDNATCLAYGDGNLEGAGDPFLSAETPSGDTFAELGWTFVGQNSAFTAATDTTGTVGDFFILNPNPALVYAVGIKDGGDPKWAVFLLPSGITSGEWLVTSPNGSLSHLALYSFDGDPVIPEDGPIVVVPEPASLALFGVGVVWAAGRMRRRARRIKQTA